MPRIRSVHPDICVSETMANLPANLERTFVRLWTHCDDEGRCEDRPRIIKAAIYPLHDDMTWEAVSDDLDGLVEAGLVVRYSVEGRGYVQICGWDEYQHPQRPRPSEYPNVDRADGPIREPSAKRRVHVPDVHVSGEGDGEGAWRGSMEVAPIASSRNEVWDALSDVFGEPETTTARSLRGKLVKSLKSAGASYDDIVTRVQAWPMHFPDATLTDTAFEKHYTTLGRTPLRASDQDVAKHQRDLELQVAQEQWERERKAIGQ